MILSKRGASLIAPAASIGVFILLWGIISLNVSAEFLPSPLAVVKEALRLLHANIGGTSLWGHIGWSLRRVLIAFFLAILLGLPLGLYMGWNRVCEKIVSPIFEVLRPIPPIAWIPIAILWLGVAEGSKIFICFVGAFVIMILNAYTGMRYVDPLLIDAGKILRPQTARSSSSTWPCPPACPPSSPGCRTRSPWPGCAYSRRKWWARGRAWVSSSFRAWI